MSIASRLLLSILWIAGIIDCAFSLHVPWRHGEASTFSSTVSTGASDVQFVSDALSLDAPKISSVNGSVFDWWYFDVVSPDRTSSLVIAFFMSTANAFPFLGNNGNVLQVELWASFPNGTATSYATHAEVATIETSLHRSGGIFAPIGMRWVGTKPFDYLITVDNSELNIKGTFHLKSSAPPHYPCGGVDPGQNLRVMPHVGWENIIPDGVGIVDMTIEGSVLKFEGSAYHDKNWGDQEFGLSSRAWYWGHARLGPYSIVWFDALSPQGSEHVSSYLAKDGKIINVECTDVKVRPEGQDSTFPPVAGGRLPEKFHVEFRSMDGLVDVVVTPNLNVAGDGTYYNRWIGIAEGCVQGRCGLEGPALFEQILPPPM